LLHDQVWKSLKLCSKICSAQRLLVQSRSIPGNVFWLAQLRQFKLHYSEKMFVDCTGLLSFRGKLGQAAGCWTFLCSGCCW